jgi:hypothetical protein
LIRAILPDWAKNENLQLKKVLEGDFNDEEIAEINAQFYNIYYLPNYPSIYTNSNIVDGAQIDKFEYCFVDMDLKGGKYESKQDFIEAVISSDIVPTRIVDSGNGVHAYWKVQDLDGQSFLRLQRRLLRKFRTDEAVCKIYQLMRLPNTLNTKVKDDSKLCKVLFEDDAIYTSEELDKSLPVISKEDEDYCKSHYNKTYAIDQTDTKVSDILPQKFGAFLRDSKEAVDIWKGVGDDRSKNDFRLGHLMFAYGFTKDEAMSVLINSAKALPRAPKHRVTYAENIVDKIWSYESMENKNELDFEDNLLDLSFDVKTILEAKVDGLKGTRFSCYKWLDNTDHGFRLGQVMGLVAGSGVGKTAVALNMFMGFVENNPNYDHFFVPLEQPAHEIADRWKTLCGTKTHLYDRVHVMDNYDKDNNFRHLSLTQIQEYLIKFQRVTKKKIGCVVIDHIGALKKKGAKAGENQDLMDICHAMKPFAIQLDVFLIMQSQAPREKAGIGDLELNKDAAYGTVFFESYCDYLVSMWQPLKRCYDKDNCPTVTALKFCKIRHKKKDKDVIKEDIRYTLLFDSNNERLREMTQDEEISFDFFNKNATNLRKQDRKTDVLSYTSMRLIGENNNGATTNHNQRPERDTQSYTVLKRQGSNNF